MLLRTIALLLFILLVPLLGTLYILIRFSSNRSFLFTQTRLGKDKKNFTIYKIQTMQNNAEQIKHKYLHLNQADGPAFKIFNDPRYTKIGRILSKTGLDELPQLINIIKGEMAFVGPRPLPLEEARQISAKYDNRFSVLPGITSLWVINGSHKLSFEEWMELDMYYIKNQSIILDLQIALKTIILLLKTPFMIVKWR